MLKLSPDQLQLIADQCNAFELGEAAAAGAIAGLIVVIIGFITIKFF